MLLQFYTLLVCFYLVPCNIVIKFILSIIVSIDRAVDRETGAILQHQEGMHDLPSESEWRSLFLA